MTEQQPDVTGDYGYDLAHEQLRRDQAPPAASPQDLARPSPAVRGTDLEYDEAHDF